MNDSNIRLWHIVVMLVIVLFMVMLFIGHSNEQAIQIINFSDFLQLIKHNKINIVRFTDNGIQVLVKNSSQQFLLNNPCALSFEFLREIADQGIIVEKLYSSVSINTIINFISNAFFGILPTLGIILFMRSMTQGYLPQSDFFDLVSNTDIKFKNVIGCENAKEGLYEIVDFLKNPDIYSNLGAKMPKGVLFYGAPGTGKTLLAKALAGESNVTFISTTGSAFQESYVSLTTKKVRKLFEVARAHAPSILFIDEIDALAPTRSGNRMHIDYIQSINELLTQLDGFKTNTKPIFLVGATNRIGSIDEALLRAGRLDRKVEITLPDTEARAQMLEYYLNNAKTCGIKIDPKINFKTIASLMYMKSGADIDNLVNEVVLYAIRSELCQITESLLIEYIDNIDLGKKETTKPSIKALEVVAYHEAGHALACVLLNGETTVIKATILPRNRVRGFVRMGPKDLSNEAAIPEKHQLIEAIKIALGARAAEELFLGPDRITTGVNSDFNQAGSIARDMVYMWGMSYGEDENSQEEIIGYHNPRVADFNSSMHLSDATRYICDQKVNKILTICYKEIKQLLSEHSDAAHALAQALLKYENLSGDQVIRIIKGEKAEFVIEERNEDINEDINTNDQNDQSTQESNSEDSEPQAET